MQENYGNLFQKLLGTKNMSPFVLPSKKNACQPKNRGVFPQNGWCYFMEIPMNKWMIWGGKHPHPYFWLETPKVQSCCF